MKEWLVENELDVVSRCCDFMLMFAWVMAGGFWLCGRRLGVSPKGLELGWVECLITFLIENWVEMLPPSPHWHSCRHGVLCTQPPNRGGVSVTQLPAVSANVSARSKEALLFLGNTKEGKWTEAWKYVSAWVFIHRKETCRHNTSMSKPPSSRDVFFFFLRLNVSPCSLKVCFLKGTIYDPIAYNSRRSTLKRKKSRTHTNMNFADILCPASESGTCLRIYRVWNFSGEVKTSVYISEMIHQMFPAKFSDPCVEKQTLKQGVWKHKHFIWTFEWVAGKTSF